MGTNIIRETERADELEAIGDGDMILSRIILHYHEKGSLTKLFKYIDPYGNAIFNHLQISDLVEDFDFLYDVVEKDYEKAMIKNIIQLLEKVRGANHKYIRFQGD